MIDPFLILRVIIFTSLGVGCIVWAMLIVQGRIRLGYAILPLSVIAHAFCFFAVRLFGGLSPASLNLWSSIIYLHIAFLAVGSGLVFLVAHDN